MPPMPPATSPAGSTGHASPGRAARRPAPAPIRPSPDRSDGGTSRRAPIPLPLRPAGSDSFAPSRIPAISNRPPRGSPRAARSHPRPVSASSTSSQPSIIEASRLPDAPFEDDIALPAPAAPARRVPERRRGLQSAPGRGTRSAASDRTIGSRVGAEGSEGSIVSRQRNSVTQRFTARLRSVGQAQASTFWISLGHKSHTTGRNGVVAGNYRDA